MRAMALVTPAVRQGQVFHCDALQGDEPVNRRGVRPVLKAALVQGLRRQRKGGAE